MPDTPAWLITDDGGFQRARTFTADAIYREGRVIRDARSRRAAAKKTRYGRMAFPVLRLETMDDFRYAADLYRTARGRGLTIRKTLDCLIAVPCIRANAPLLHADPDFDRLASCTPLRIYSE